MMETDRPDLESTARSMVDAALRVHREAGAGLLESVYQSCSEHELRARGHQVTCELPLPIRYRGAVRPRHQG